MIYLNGDVGSSDEDMSGNGAASGDHEPGFATPGDADGFLTVLGRKERKKTQRKDHTRFCDHGSFSDPGTCGQFGFFRSSCAGDALAWKGRE